MTTSNFDENALKKLKTQATSASVGVAIVLSVIKAGAGIATGSLSVLSSMVDSLTDVFSSAISFVAVRFSNKPLTKEHRFGYGKAEAVSSLLQSAFITGSGGFILYDGISRMINPVEVKHTIIGISIMLISLLLSLGLIIFQTYVIKKTNSSAIRADSLHYSVDLLSNLAIIVSLLAVKYCQWQWLDTATAVCIAVYLLWNAFGLAMNALSEITDREIGEEQRNQIVHIIKAEPLVLGHHDLRTRVSGMRIFVEMHLEFDGDMKLTQLHDISQKVEEKIVAMLPTAQVIIHQDPFGLHEKRIDHEIDGSCDL